MDISYLIIFYEPRILIRDALYSRLTSAGHRVVSCLSMEQLTENLCDQQSDDKILLLGVGGVGRDLRNVLRICHRARSLVARTLIYLPEQDVLLTRLFMGAGATACLTEAMMECSLMPVLHERKMRPRYIERLSYSELKVVLDFASGMNAHEIALQSAWSYKTVFSFKRNACIRLGVETKTEWLGLLTSTARLAAIYDKG